MAPEQLIRPKDVDRRADVFALGVLLYEMLAGGRPFVGTTAVEVNDRILNFTPPAPSKVSKEVPAGLDPVCLKALQKDAGARYQDVDALRREVDKVRKTLQAHEAGPSGGELAMGLEWVSRNRDGVIVGFVLATLFYVPLLLIIVVIVRLAR
jgi:serine/threonine-protein kinase